MCVLAQPPNLVRLLNIRYCKIEKQGRLLAPAFSWGSGLPDVVGSYLCSVTRQGIAITGVGERSKQILKNHLGQSPMLLINLLKET